MKSSVEKLLFATLSRSASYQEKQMLKRGEIVPCAEVILRRRRRNVLWMQGFLSLYLLLMVILQMFEESASRSLAGLPVWLLCAVSILPSWMEQRMQVSRLETLLGFWLLLKEDQTGDATPEQREVLLEQVLGNG